MGVDSFLNDATSAFDVSAADNWFLTQTTLNLTPAGSRQYITPSQLTFLTNLSGTIVTTSGATFTGDIICQNFTANGSSTFINTTNLAVQDPLVAIGTGNTVADTVDLGQYGTYFSSGAVKYFSIFRDASDSGKVKVLHNLTNQPSGSIVDTTGGIASTFTVGNLETTTLTLGGTAVTATATELNRATSVNPGTATALKFLATNSSNNLNSSGAITAAQLLAGIDLRLTNAVPWLVVKDTSDFYLESSTNPAGPAESTSDRVIFYGSASGLNSYVGCNGLQMLSGATSLTMKSPTTFSGCGVNISGGVVLGSINSSGIAPTVTSSTSLLNISGGSLGMIYLPYSGTLSAWQPLTIYNSSSGGDPIILAHNATSSGGFLKCRWFQLQPRQSVDVVFDLPNTCWILKQTPNNLFDMNIFKWTDDNILSCFLNANNTYHAKIKFCSSVGTINNVSGFENSTSTNTSGTNWNITNVSGSINNNNATPSSLKLTDTQSTKFDFNIFGYTALTLTFPNLTKNNYYMINIWVLLFDSSSRTLLLTDVTNNRQLNYDYQSYGTGAANSPVPLLQYVFRTTQTSRVFNILGSSCDLYGITLCNLGPSL